MDADKKLLEDAAKAVGLSGPFSHGSLWLQGPWGGSIEWNPLTDDGDALRLAVNLSFLVDVNLAERVSDVISAQSLKREGGVNTSGVGEWHAEHGGDAAAATRRAIVRAAAAIGSGELDVR